VESRRKTKAVRQPFSNAVTHEAANARGLHSHVLENAGRPAEVTDAAAASKVLPPHAVGTPTGVVTRRGTRLAARAESTQLKKRGERNWSRGGYTNCCGSAAELRRARHQLTKRGVGTGGNYDGPGQGEVDPPVLGEVPRKLRHSAFGQRPGIKRRQGFGARPWRSSENDDARFGGPFIAYSGCSLKASGIHPRTFKRIIQALLSARAGGSAPRSKGQPALGLFIVREHSAQALVGRGGGGERKAEANGRDDFTPGLPQFQTPRWAPSSSSRDEAHFLAAGGGVSISSDGHAVPCSEQRGSPALDGGLLGQNGRNAGRRDPSLSCFPASTAFDVARRSVAQAGPVHASYWVLTASTALEGTFSGGFESGED